MSVISVYKLYMYIQCGMHEEEEGGGGGQKKKERKNIE